jgi:transcriptional regulator with XRE-family HTH domain
MIKGEEMPKFGVGHKKRPPETDFGKLILARRLELGITQGEVARRVGVNATTVGQWEINPIPYISNEKIPKLAEVLGIETATIETVVLKRLRRAANNGPATLRKPLTEFGKLIQDRRVSLGITHKRLRELTGFSTTGLIRWEYGEEHAFPRALNLSVVVEKLASALQIETEQILAVIPKEVEETFEPRYELGRFIRQRRNELKLTMTALTEKIGKSIETVRQVEKQGRSLRPDSVEAWAKVLQVSQEELRSKFSRKKVGQPEKPAQTEFGSFIRSARKAMGFSGDEFAEKIGVTRQQISKIEIGRYGSANNGLVGKLAEVLGVDVAELQELVPSRRLRQSRKESRSALGNFIIKRRLELNLSGVELSRRTGISSGALSLLEAGLTSNPRKETLEMLSAVIGEIPAEVLPIQEVYRDASESEGEVSVVQHAMAVLRLDELAAEDLLAVKQLGRIKKTSDAFRKGIKVLRRLLEKQGAGYRLLLVKDNETIELDLML